MLHNLFCIQVSSLSGRPPNSNMPQGVYAAQNAMCVLRRAQRPKNAKCPVRHLCDLFYNAVMLVCAKACPYTGEKDKYPLFPSTAHASFMSSTGGRLVCAMMGRELSLSIGLISSGSSVMSSTTTAGRSGLLPLFSGW